MSRLLERLVPDSVSCAETRADRLDIDLFPIERLSLGRAVDKRRWEFMAGRACARQALSRLGIPAVAIPSGNHGEPLWPPGVVGSITHCDGYRACAAARSEEIVTVGIDAEPNAPLPEGVLEEVVHGRELELVTGGSIATERNGCGVADQVDVDRLRFSAKEAVYKAWFPLARRWLGFEDVELSIDLATSEFCARLLVAGPVVDAARLTEFRGRWAVADGVICTAVVVRTGARQRPHGGG